MLCGIATAVSVALAFAYLSWAGILFGVCLGVAVLIHEAMVKWAGGRTSPLLLKEIGVCVIFTAGIWGLPLIRQMLAARPVALWQWMLVLQYMLLVLANLIEFSWLEMCIDEHHGQTSFVRGIGSRVRTVAGGAIALQAPLATVVLILARQRRTYSVQAIYAGMALILLAILIYPEWFERDERYRAWGDGVFIAPLLLLLIR